MPAPLKQHTAPRRSKTSGPTQNRSSSNRQLGDTASARKSIGESTFRFALGYIPAATPRTYALKTWCTGEGSNLRRSKDRQIYSLLPLTTRPPVHKYPAPLKTPDSAHQSPSGANPAFCNACTSVGSPRRTGPALRNRRRQNLLPLQDPFRPSEKWSWRRDLNPRPSDYKSDALPAELRQPYPPGEDPGNL